MPGHDIIVVGASAGGVEAMKQLVQKLPPDLQAALFFVLHIPAEGTSALPFILRRAGPLPAAHARDGQAIRPGHIYIAPPNFHLRIRRGYMRLTHGPSENGHRPAIDPLFRSAALAYGPRVVGVILSGTLDDGTAGLAVIKEHGGVAVVQHPEEALFEGMPCNAIEYVEVDHVLPVADIAALLTRLALSPVQEGDFAVAEELQETEYAENHLERIGTPSVYTCPGCHGTLWEVEEGELIHFRCRVGHRYSAESLLGEQTEALNEAMWTAFRALKENAALARRLAERAQRRSQPFIAERFEAQARETEARAAIIERTLLNGKGGEIQDPPASVETPFEIPPDYEPDRYVK